jgi:hypothetical protein
MYKMHHPKADIDRLYVKRKEGGRRLLQVEAAYKAEIINITEYLNTKYKEDRFVNIVKVHDSTQPNMNSILKLAAKILEELYQLSGMNDTKTGWNATHDGKIERGFKEEMEKQSNARAVYKEYR